MTSLENELLELEDENQLIELADQDDMFYFVGGGNGRWLIGF